MIKDFLAGITSYFSAFTTISRLGLWKYFLVPIIISLILASGLGVAIWTLSGTLAAWLLPWIPWETVTGWVLNILLGLVGFVLFKHLAIAAVSPFMTPLAQKVEEHLTGNYTKYSGFSTSQAIKDFFRGITIALSNIVKELIYVIPLFLLGLFPPLSIPCAILIFLTQAYYAGFGNMDYTLEGHYSVSESKRFVKQYRWLAIGNGTVFLLLLGTGVGFLVAPPLATVAAATETTKRLND
ncbi:MAG: EI24 domain-containing protein [Bacteroidota bacterium]